MRRRAVPCTDPGLTLRRHPPTDPAQVLTHKLDADDADGRQGTPKASMPAFVVEYFMQVREYFVQVTH